MDASDRAEKTAAIQRGRPFERGKSGNPKGRPKGARNVATVLAESMLDSEANAITRKVIEKAMEGDSTALRLCLERLLPPRRGRPVAFELPEIKTVADAGKASSSVLAACAAGTLSPGESSEIMALISSHVGILETTEIEARLTALEKARQT
jgi:hypothetical protein